MEFAIRDRDGKTVVVMHTSRLGLLRRIGKFDFYANGGLTQPGCNFQPWESHKRSLYILYITFDEKVQVIGVNENGEKCRFGVWMHFQCEPGKYYFITTRYYPFRFEDRREGKLIETQEEIEREKIKREKNREGRREMLKSNNAPWIKDDL